MDTLIGVQIALVEMFAPLLVQNCPKSSKCPENSITVPELIIVRGNNMGQNGVQPHVENLAKILPRLVENLLKTVLFP